MSGAVKITRLELSAAELRTRAGRIGDGSVVRRLLALALVLEGASRETAARLNGMTRQTLRDWVHRYNAEGIDGLKSGTGSGRPPRLTAEQRADLRALVLAGPDLEQHGVIRWRCVDLCREVARRFSVSVCEQTMGKWLRHLGLTRLQPRPSHPRKDAGAGEAFKKFPGLGGGFLAGGGVGRAPGGVVPG
jgi:transposase